MNNFSAIEFHIRDRVAYLTLNRPEVRNAFNDQMIAELREAFSLINDSRELIAVILRGNGPVFSAGADLNWMKSTLYNSYEQNRSDSSQLQELFEAFYHIGPPAITVIHGACIGGANGLAAASDVVLAEEQTQFRFSEVRLGLIPATIAPFIIHRMGSQAAKYYMLSGKAFRGEEALRNGLVNAIGDQEKLDTELDILLKELPNNSPQAMWETKRLINQIGMLTDEQKIRERTVDAIAAARVSEDGQEGMQAFLEKRKPRWVPG